MYHIEYYNVSQLEQIKTIWLQLQNGTDMTYFQSYHWYEMLNNFLPPHKSFYEIKFVVVYKDDQAMIIAPLFIIKRTHFIINKKGVYIWGRNGWSDYLNLIYKVFVPDAFDFLCNDLKNHYKVSNFHFERLKETSQLYHYILNNMSILSKKRQVCVKLDLPSSFEEYWNSLSKHSKQNIRTAQNRLKKSNLQIVVLFDDVNVDKNLCYRLRLSRVKNKNQNLPMFKRIKIKIVSLLSHKMPSYFPLYSDTKSKNLTGYIDDELCSFFNYAHDINKNEILIMGVGIDNRFSKYSPGILCLYNYIKAYYDKSEISIKSIDFTRGDEKYKYAIGGKEFFIYDLVCS